MIKRLFLLRFILMLKSLHIQDFKGFYEKQGIGFAIPDQQNVGSGLTLIVGPNNSGKTTILEALLMNTGKKFKETERHGDKDPHIQIKTSSGVITRYTNLEKGSVVKVLNDHKTRFEVIPSRRFWPHVFNGQQEFDNFINASSSKGVKVTGDFDLGPILRKILTTPGLKDIFNAYLSDIVPSFTDWTLDTNATDQDYIKYKTTDGWHEANLLGDGIISLFRIVAHLVHDKESTFIIDEPELSLHPTAQKRLASFISKLSKSKQIIVCTHSPYFISWLDFLAGAKIIRLSKNNGSCKVGRLNNKKKYTDFISRSVTEYQKPQLLDTVSKEILFSEKILFVEGQEDVGLIKKWYLENKKDLNFDIFGYGVGGETNMSLFFELAKDLGVEKVAAVFDGNSLSFTSSVIRYPKFCLKQLSTEDIRDKASTCQTTCPNHRNREGTFTASGDLKSTHRDFFEEIMNDLEIYFNG